MRNLFYLIVSVIAVTLILGFSTKTTMAADAMPESGTGVINVIIDNDDVRVVEATRHPGTKVPMHTHPTYLAYFFSPCKLKLTSPEGKSKVVDVPTGKLMWVPNGRTHSVEVMGNMDQHVLVIELKKLAIELKK